MPNTPFDPVTGKHLALSPEEASTFSAWTTIDIATVSVSSTSRLAMSDTSMLQKGIALRYVIGADTLYGVVDDISDDTYIDVRGAPLTGTPASLEYGIPQQSEQMDIFIAGKGFAATSADLLDTVMNAAFQWILPTAYLVGFSGKLKTADSTVNPKVNVELGGDKVSTNDSNNGIQPSDSRVDNPLVAIDVANYKVEYKDAVEVPCTVKAGTEDAADLTLSCVFVWE